MTVESVLTLTPDTFSLGGIGPGNMIPLSQDKADAILALIAQIPRGYHAARLAVDGEDGRTTTYRLVNTAPLAFTLSIDHASGIFMSVDFACFRGRLFPVGCDCRKPGGEPRAVTPDMVAETDDQAPVAEMAELFIQPEIIDTMHLATPAFR
jgi:hypothetical protein